MTNAPEPPPPVTPLPPPPLSESAPRPVPGGGLPISLLAGLALSGSILLLVIPALGIAWAVIAGILAGAVLRQARHVITVLASALVLPLATSFLATCPTGAWGWLVVGIVLATVGLVLVTPIAFGIGRVIRPRVSGAYPLLLAVLVAGGVLSVLGWFLVLADAIAPGTCPPGPGA